MGRTQQLNTPMQHYELMLLISGAIAPEQLPSIRTRVEQYIQQVGGTITATVELERRRLAYRIRQQSYGTYVIVQCDAAAKAVRELDQKLRLDNEVMRYIIVKSAALEADRIREMVAGEKYKLKKPEPVVVGGAKTSVTALTEEEKLFAETKRTTQPDVTETTKVSIEELDKKLDAILEDTDITAKF